MATKMMKKILATLLALTLMFSLTSVAVSAKKEDTTGTGQTQVHIHGVGDIGKNKDKVTIIVGENRYEGELQGSKLEIEIDSTDNGFDFDKGESMDIQYEIEGGGKGTITITHQEGNGTNIGKEHDEGLNNFKGSVKPNETPYKSVVVSVEPHGFDMMESEIISNAIGEYDKFKPIGWQLAERHHKDFQLIDYTLLAGAINFDAEAGLSNKK